MPQIVLVIGPSGIGKSSICCAVKDRLPECAFDHLDDLAARHAKELRIITRANVHDLRSRLNDDERFLRIGLEAIRSLAAKLASKCLIVDVGAGFQVAPSARHLHKLYPLVAITASPEAAHRRFVQYRVPRERDEFDRTEFSEHRSKVYDSAHHRIDATNLTLSQTAEKFSEVLRRILAPRLS